MNIAIYIRKSVTGTDRSISLEAQKEMCKDYFKGDNTFEVFQDRGISGKNTDRPAFQNLIERVSRKEFNVVVCYKFDRIARNTLDFLTILELFKKYDTDLISITEGYDPRTPAGKMMVTLLASLAEMERENIRSRIIDSMSRLAREGRYSGGPTPFGYELDKTPYGTYLKLVDGDRIKYLFDSFLKGKTHRELAKELNITHKGIKIILRNPLYMKSSNLAIDYLKSIGYEVIVHEDRIGKGFLTYGKRNGSICNKIAVTSLHEAVIEATQWIETQVRLKTFDGHQFPRISIHTWLSQLIKCTNCNSIMKVKHEKSGTYLKCPNKCYKHLNAAKTEKLVFEALREISLNKDIYQDNINYNNLSNEVGLLTKEIDNKEKLVSGLIDKLALAGPTIANRLIKTLEEYETNLNELKMIRSQKLILMEKGEINTFFDSEKELNEYIEVFEKLDMKDKQKSIRNVINIIEYNGENLIIK